MPSGRVGKAIVLACFFTAGYGRHRKLGVGFRTAGYGRHRSQWVKGCFCQCLNSCTSIEAWMEEETLSSYLALYRNINKTTWTTDMIIPLVLILYF